MEFFEDGQYLSSYRLIHISWGIGVLAVWIYLNLYGCLVLHTVTMIGINPTVLGFLTTLTGGKLLQNMTESKQSDTLTSSVPSPTSQT